MRKILRGFRCAALVGAALLGVVSARAAVYETVEYYDPVAKQKKTAYCRIILPDEWGGDVTLYTDWYAVKGKFTSAVTTMRINGSVKLILCDDAELTVNGQGHAAIELFEGKNVDGVPNSLTIYGQSAGNGRLVANGGEFCAGIGSSANVDKQTAGELIVNGGIVVANGSRNAAGIGGANCFDGNSRLGYGNGGRVEINGGQVTATGGIYNGWYGAGIGGALRGCSGDIIIRGGTVRAICRSVDGYGIGGGPEAGSGHPSSLTILGGSVNARTPEGFAKNSNNAPLQCVKVSCSDLSDPLTIEGINYGSRDIYKDSDYVYLWLPNGNHKFTLSDARMARLYQVKVDGAPVTVDPATVGLRIGNTDVNQGTGDNWTYDVRNNVLTINKLGWFVLSGEVISDAPQVNVAANNATVVLKGVKLVANNRPALVVQNGVSATLRAESKTSSTLSATGGSSAMKVDGTLTVDLDGDADRDTSKINVSSSGSNAVSGGGKLTINDGTFCAQGGNNQSAIGLQDGKFVLGQKVVMKAGTGSSSTSYTTNARNSAYVLVAPALSVTVSDIPNVKVTGVSPNDPQNESLTPTQEGGSVYRVMKGDNVFVHYQSTDGMHLVTGENPVKLTVTKDEMIGANKLEVSAIQVLADGYHYLESTTEGKQWIDTGWRPTKKARIEADFHSMTRSQEWGVFFGLTGYDSSSDGILLRYSAANTLNGWFCNGTYSEAEIGSLANTRIFAELQAGSMILNGEKKGIKTEGDPCNKGSIYLFCGNNFEGGNEPHDWRHQAMKLFSFKIWDVENGEEKLVRDFVPFKTANGKVCGLYDLVKEEPYLNKATSGEPFQLGRDPRVRYRIWDEKARAMRDEFTPSEPIPVTAVTTAFEKDKWYVVTNEVSCPTITVKGNAHLILCDGAKLTATGNGEHAGIAVAAGQSLTIYGQRFGTGELEAKGGENCAGIGGGNYAAGGTVTIYGGKVSATGGWNGAGIGGGHSGNGGATTIYGGMVTVTGTGGAAGIGGGIGENVKGGTVAINGGTVKATGDYQDALPEGYTAVEYIESTKGGGQYIDTEYTANANTKVVMDAYLPRRSEQADTWGVLFGSRTYGNPWTIKSFSFQMANGDGGIDSFRFAYNGQFVQGGSKPFSYGERVSLICDGTHIEWTGSKAGAVPFSAGSPLEQSKSTLYIFGDNSVENDGEKRRGAWNPSIMKLYSFRIYEDEKLERNFVPCVSASGEAGLYDTVHGKFYGNCGKNGDFKTGLPAGYKRVEYIESTKGGNQYINTGYVPTTTTRVECVVNVANNQPKSEAAVFGAHSKVFGESTQQNMSFFAWFRSSPATAYNRGSEEKRGGPFIYDTQVRLVCGGLNASWQSMDGRESDSITNTGVIEDGNPGYPFYIFALDEPNGNPPCVPFDRTYLAMKLYSFQIYEDEKLERDFVPCVNTATGEAGLYDTVEGKFYGNAGAGRFAFTGSGAGGLGGKVTINGGNVRGEVHGDMPKNTADSTLCCVRVKVEGLKVEKLKVEGLGDYGLNDVQAIVNSYTGTPELYLWLPPGKHAFTVSDGTTTNSYFAVVSGLVQYMTVEPLKEANVWVNGKDIFKESGTGWSYDFVERLLTLSGGSEANYVISGTSLDGLVRIKVTADANVTFSNATFQASSDAVITVKDGCKLHLSAGNGENAAYLLGDGVNVIKGGSTVVENGSVCLWSTNAVPVDGTFSINPENEIMCVGKEESNLPYVKDYKPSETDRIILVAPRCRLAVPVVEHAAIKVSVQNPNAELQGKTGTGEGGIAVMVYELMLGDAAVVSCTLEENYVWIGNRDVQNITINQAYIEMSRGQLPRIVGEGFTAHYRAAKVDPDTAAVSYETKSEPAILFDKIANNPGAVGQGAHDEEWYVVTGKVRCASVCVTKGRVNLILYPGAELTLQGEDDQPGLGVMSNAWLTIYGCTNGVGTLVASGGSCAAGIGGGGGAVSEGAPGPDAGTITVNGGVVTAIGGDFGAGIGGGPHGKGAHLTVNGGTVFAYGGYDADDIGGGTYGKDGVTVVNGGNVMANSVEAKPVNAANEKLYRVYVVSEKFIPTNDVPLAVVGLNVYDTLVDLNGYGTADVFADDENGVICFYLPNGHYEFTVDRWKCFADVQDGTASAVVTEERVPEEDEGEGGGEGEQGGEGEGEGGEGEDPGDVWDGVDYAEVLGIEIGVPVKITVRTRVNWNYRLKRVTFEGGKMVVGDAIDFMTARSSSLTLEDDEPPAGAGFYVVEQSLK